MAEKQIFKIEFSNQQRLELAKVYGKNGAVILCLAPRETQILETSDPTGIYVRWQQVIFKDAGEIVLVPRSDFEPTEKGRIIEMLNTHGNSVEFRTINGQSVCLPRGIPRFIEVGVADPMAIYSKLEIKSVLHREPSATMKHYITHSWINEDVLTERSEDDKKEIETELKAINGT